MMSLALGGIAFLVIMLIFVPINIYFISKRKAAAQVQIDKYNQEVDQYNLDLVQYQKDYANYYNL